MLLYGGHTVDTADVGKAGLALYKVKHHGMVLTDIAMPDMDRLALIDRLRQTEPRPRVIAISDGHSRSTCPPRSASARNGFSQSRSGQTCSSRP